MINKIHTIHLTFFGLMLLFACNQGVTDKGDLNNTTDRTTNSFKTVDSLNKALDWRELNCGLWINNKGVIGFKVIEFTDIGKVVRYRTQLWFSKEGKDTLLTFNSILDTTSFKHLGGDYYKDKNHIYHHYTMSDGGYVNLRNDIDYQTFKILHVCYAKDKNHVYDYRGRIIDVADVKTFKTSNQAKGCFAKDKNYYYQWGDTLSVEEMKDSIVMEAIKILNR